MDGGELGARARIFCTRLSAFKKLSLFFCNSQLDRPPRLSTIAPDISKSAEIFGEDSEIEVTLQEYSKKMIIVILLNYYFYYLYE